jgi:RimJ/RimL family protein N-acetyltransferase
MRHHLEQWERFGIGKFVVERLEDGIVVGRVGIQLLDPTTWEPADGVPELGWTLAPEHRGKGYATGQPWRSGPGRPSTASSP